MWPLIKPEPKPEPGPKTPRWPICGIAIIIMRAIIIIPACFPSLVSGVPKIIERQPLEVSFTPALSDRPGLAIYRGHMTCVCQGNCYISASLQAGQTIRPISEWPRVYIIELVVRYAAALPANWVYTDRNEIDEEAEEEEEEPSAFSAYI